MSEREPQTVQLHDWTITSRDDLNDLFKRLIERKQFEGERARVELVPDAYLQLVAMAQQVKKDPVRAEFGDYTVYFVCGPRKKTKTVEVDE